MTSRPLKQDDAPGFFEMNQTRPENPVYNLILMIITLIRCVTGERLIITNLMMMWLTKILVPQIIVPGTLTEL